MIFWCLNNKTISNYKKSTYGSFMCMLFDAYGHILDNMVQQYDWLKNCVKEFDTMIIDE